LELEKKKTFSSAALSSYLASCNSSEAATASASNFFFSATALFNEA